MKYLMPIWLMLLELALFSCTERKKLTLLPELLRAEALMYTHPDSALLILESMPMPDSADHLQHATWCLFMTQARDKNYKKHTSDSLINIAYDYFSEHGNSHQKALAANYKGVVNQELERTELAMHCYLEAAKEVQYTTDYQLAHLIQIRLGLVYVYRSLMEYAMPAFQKSYHFAKLSGNEMYISSSLSFIARVYTKQGKWDKAIEYYTKAIHAAEKAPRRVKSYCNALGELSVVYTRKREYKLALKYARKSLETREKEQFPIEQSLLHIGDIYRLTGQSDSAAHYLHQASLSDNIRTTRQAYQALYFLNQEDGNYQKALAYNDKFWLYTDSIQKIDRSKEVIEMQEKYNQEKLLNEKNRLKIEKERMVRSGLILLLFLLVAMALLIYFYQRKLIKKERKIQQNEEAIRQYMVRIHENESLINRNETRRKKLTSLIEENQGVQEQLEEQQAMLVDIQCQNSQLRQENRTFQENIAHYSTSLQEKVKELDTFTALAEENQRLHDREKFLCTQLLKRTEVLNALKVFPKRLDPAGWEVLRDAIDFIYENYSQRLARQLPSLTEGDIQVCCFIKIHLTNDDMGTLFGISSSSVSKRKQRLKEHIVQDLGRPFDANQTLDLWLWEY